MKNPYTMNLQQTVNAEEEPIMAEEEGNPP